MAMINCPGCGKEISDKAEKCPKCGYPLEKENFPSEEQKAKSKTNKILFLIAGLISGFILGIFVGYTMPGENNESVTTENDIESTNSTHNKDDAEWSYVKI